MTRTTTPLSGASAPKNIPAPLVLLAPLGPLPAPLLPPELLPGLPWILGAAALLVPPAVALFRRITRGDVLDTPSRRALLDAVEDHPGATVATLARHLDLDYSTVAYHVGILTEFDLVTPRREGQRRRIYPASDAPRRPRPLRGVPETALDILRLVLREPGISQARAARRLGLARSTVHWHVERLSSRDLVARHHRAGLAPGPALEGCRRFLLPAGDGPAAA